MALFRNLLQTIKKFKVGNEMTNKNIAEQVEAVRCQREKFKELDVKRNNAKNRKEIMQQNINLLTSKIERKTKEIEGAIEAAVLGETGDALISLKKLKSEKAA